MEKELICDKVIAEKGTGMPRTVTIECHDFKRLMIKLEDPTKEFMDGMVEKITVYENNRIEIVWRYGDEFEYLG